MKKVDEDFNFDYRKEDSFRANLICDGKLNGRICRIAKLNTTQLGYTHVAFIPITEKSGGKIDVESIKRLDKYLVNESEFIKEEDNIVKKVCQIFDLTQKELGEMLDVPHPTISRWYAGDIPKMAKIALELLLENKQLKDKLQKIKEAQNILTNL